MLTFALLLHGLVMLGLPASKERNLLLNTTLLVVLFSILVQGLSVGRPARRICTHGSPGCH